MSKNFSTDVTYTLNHIQRSISIDYIHFGQTFSYYRVIVMYGIYTHTNFSKIDFSFFPVDA